jgi:MFS family permease
MAFLSTEIPVQLLIKRYGFNQILPAMMIGWSLVSWTQAWITGRASFYITRALIGAFEGGFIPGTILFATYFYKTRELSVRLAFFWSTLNVCSQHVRVAVANLQDLITFFVYRLPVLSPPFLQRVFSRCEESRERPDGSGCS